MKMNEDIITILGPTACGKTRFAVQLAYFLDAEIISADSRQVYRGMDLGTGKDLDDYVWKGKKIPYHLIDIVAPGYKYNIYEYQRDFLRAYEDIKSRGKNVVVCGGSGLYLESVLRGYKLSTVPKNESLRSELERYSLAELKEKLRLMRPLHNDTDTDTVQRAIRAIEIETFNQLHPAQCNVFPELTSLTLGLNVDRDTRRERISSRLRKRLEEGMLDEIRLLLKQGVTPDELIYYGLEYKFLTQHVIGELSYEEMYKGLEIAIHQFAKRQMTWFRGMERRGISIEWVDVPAKDMDMEYVESLLNGQVK